VKRGKEEKERDVLLSSWRKKKASKKRKMGRKGGSIVLHIPFFHQHKGKKKGREEGQIEGDEVGWKKGNSKKGKACVLPKALRKSEGGKVKKEIKELGSTSSLGGGRKRSMMIASEKVEQLEERGGKKAKKVKNISLYYLMWREKGKKKVYEVEGRGGEKGKPILSVFRKEEKEEKRHRHALWDKNSKGGGGGG